MNDTVTGASSRGGRGLAALALLLAVGAIGLAAYPYYQQRFGGAVDVAARLQSQQLELQQLQRSLADASAAVDARLNQQQAALAEQLQAQQSRVAGLLADVTGSEATAAGAARMARVLGLSEALHLVQTAARRASLFADSVGAAALLAAAQQTLEGIDAPTSVGQALSDARTALSEQAGVDVDALLVRLESLSQSLPEPLPERGYAAVPDAAPAGEGIWQAALQKFLSLFALHRRGELAEEPLDVATAVQLKLNVELLLKTSQLALLRGDEPAFREGLGAARRLLERYRGAAEERASAAITEIDQLSVVPLGQTPPDLTGLIHQLQTALDAQLGVPLPVESAAAQAPPAPAPEPELQQAPAAADSAP